MPSPATWPSVYGTPWRGDADVWKLIDVKLYNFDSQASKDAFDLDERSNLALAEKWRVGEVKDDNGFLGAWRLICRVPHYRSGDEWTHAASEAKVTTMAAR